MKAQSIAKAALPVIALFFIGAAQSPTIAELTFRLTPKGQFHAEVITDTPLPAGCTVELFARSKANSVVGEIIPLGIMTEASESVAEFNSSNLPAVHNVAGAIPQLHLQARVVCDTSIVTSNVAAQFIQSGRSAAENARVVSIERWLELLAKRVPGEPIL